MLEKNSIYSRTELIIFNKETVDGFPYHGMHSMLLIVYFFRLDLV